MKHATFPRSPWLPRLALLLWAPCLLLAPLACGPGAGTDSANAALQEEAQAFLDTYTAEFLQLYATAAEADWQANIRIVEGDETARKAAEAANEAQAQFTGSQENIEQARKFLEGRDQLDPLQVRQLEAVLYAAANNPQTVPELVKQRIAAEAIQNEQLFGFDFQINGESVTTNAIDDILENSDDLAARQIAWEASKEVGPPLRDGLASLVELRNQTVQALEYDDYFEYQVSDYGMTTAEMMELLEGFIRDVWPLYRELHTWARYELAQRYGEEVPEMLPAHWLPNRWGQDWAALVTVEGLDLDAQLSDKSKEWVVEQAERFFVSLGFDPLPEVFYEKSSLYPVPEGESYKKNNHASAWHMDLQNDVRSLMSVQPNQRWWGTTHHELGHIYYYMAYTRPEVPPLLRTGANRAFHEGVGTLLGMVSVHPPFLEGLGMRPEGSQPDGTQQLLREALDAVVFIPFSAGTMSHFERDLYTEAVQPDGYNARWWEYVAKYQGIVPPSPRDEAYNDAATKTHINNDPAQYYDYALSYMILHQLHAHISTEILGQDPRSTNYYGSQEAGAFLHSILELGGTRDWREVMQEKLGQEISGKAMLEYFAPLMEYLQQENEGRAHTLPETV
jgi:peptidyl-dipeptidase A